MILIHISGVFAAAVHIVIGIILEATVYRDKIKRLMMLYCAGCYDIVCRNNWYDLVKT